MIKVNLSTGSYLLGERVTKNPEWDLANLKHKWICLMIEVVETVNETKIETYREPRGKEDKTREVINPVSKIVSHETFINSDYITYIEKVKNG